MTNSPKYKPIKGVWTALVTPFKGGELDLVGYRKLLRLQKAAGVSGVIPCGTTGETPTLTTDEKKSLIQVALEELKGSPVGVIAGTGSNDTRASVEFSKWASDQGVDGVLTVVPYYNKPSQAGLEAHFRAIADAVSCPVVLYNVPGRTVTSMTPATIVSLASHPNITAIKEATGNIVFASELIDQLSLKGASLDLLSGDDATYLAFLSAGGHGVISVTSNIAPAEMVALQKAAEENDFATARRIHQRLYPLFRDLFAEPNPVPVKYALEYLGVCGSEVRLPLVPMGRESIELIRNALRRADLREGAHGGEA